jgi:hypothetical protein
MYDEDWSQGFQVESMAFRWCITAHGAAKILLQSAHSISEFPDHLHDHFVGLLNLQDEADAQLRLNNCLAALGKTRTQKASIDPDQTPRPRLDSRDPDLDMAIMPVIADPSISRLRPPIKAKPISTATFALPQSSMTRGWLSWPATVCIVLGWWVLDVGYSAQGQAISTLTMVVAGFAVLFCLLGVFSLLGLNRTQRLWVWSLWIQATGQWVLTLELWVYGMPIETVWSMGLAPTVVMLTLLLMRTAQK